jgi:adenine deaminase
MNVSAQRLERTIAAAAKRTVADVVVKNSRIIDVFNQEIILGDVAITDGLFVGIGEYEGTVTIDAQNRFLCPGFIDGHVHIESSMLTPGEFAKTVLPHGVTAVVADPHEIGNVSGVDGIDYMIRASEDLPLDIYYMLPSCVPATPFENAGAVLSAEHLAPFYRHERVIGLGEVMNAPAVRNGDPSMLDKLLSASAHEKLIDGHAAGLNAEAINVYGAAGIRTDHECTEAEEVRERLRRGMYVMLREGSAAKNLQALLPAVNSRNARRCFFVTDDKHLDDLVDEGSIDHSIRLSIQAGVVPLQAIQMATLNTAECFRLTRKGAIAPGYDADFLLLDELEPLTIFEVYKAGKRVAANGVFVGESLPAVDPPAPVVDSIRAAQLAESDLQIVFQNRNASANMIGIIPNSIVTRHLVEPVDLDDQLRFQPSIAKDHLKIAVVERHRSTGNVGLGILQGLGLTSGAIGSTVAHDSHNIVVAGTNDGDILKATQTIREIKGGLVVVDNGTVLASLPLPIAGLISDKDFQTVYGQLGQLNEALRQIGFRGAFNPFLTLGFLTLPVIPQLKVTDLGLFHVGTLSVLPVELT